MSLLDQAAVLADLDGYLDKVKDLVKENPAAVSVLLIAMQRLQGLVEQAGMPETHEKPKGADAIREMARGAISNLKASQSTLEKFIHASLETTEGLLSVVEMLVKDLT